MTKPDAPTPLAAAEMTEDELRERERLLIRQIMEIQQRAQTEIEPIAKMLSTVRLCIRPEPFLTPDGLMMQYIGPRGRMSRDGNLIGLTEREEL